MLGVRVKIERQPPEVWKDLPRFGRRLILGAAILSLLIHMLSYMSALRFGQWDSRPQILPNDKVKIRITDATLKTPKDSAQKRIMETPQAETKPPVDSTHSGPQDHATEKETKLARNLLNNDRALDPGVRGKQDSHEAQKNKAATAPSTALPTPRQIITGAGTLAIPGSNQVKPRNNYERLLPSKESDVFGTPTAGYTEYIDAKIPEGDRLDMNTTNFKFISYFTGLRKQIELVWIYPREAVERGLQGEVLLEIIIEKDGKVSRVRVLNSSGFALLDENMVKTIKLASPFAPLPKSWKKERVLVTGSFHYILSYGAH